MNDRTRLQWERLGRTDPYWAVLAGSKRANNAEGWDIDEFFRTGEHEVAKMLDRLIRFGFLLNFDTALDFGCGLGRLSRALAGRFHSVIATDIASSMLAEAGKLNHEYENIDFRLNESASLKSIASNSIDFIYSNIVLQHMPKADQLSFINEFNRILKPGGVAVFQIPSSPRLGSLHGWLYRLFGNRILNLARKVYFGQDRIMEVHWIHESVVSAYLRKLGFTDIRIERSAAAGNAFEDRQYFCKKLKD